MSDNHTVILAVGLFLGGAALGVPLIMGIGVIILAYQFGKFRKDNE
jgi:hypothetical protein